MAQIRTVEGNARCELYLKVSEGIDEDEKLIVVEVEEYCSAQEYSFSNRSETVGAVMALLNQRPSGQYYTATES